MTNKPPESGETVEPWGPSEDGLDLPYWEGLEAGELRLQRCGSCATWIWGPQWICGKCHTFDPEWQAVTPHGTVYSWSRSFYPFMTEFADRSPYVTVLVELPGADGRRVLGMLTENDEVRIGDTVTGRFERAPGEARTSLRWIVDRNTA